VFQATNTEENKMNNKTKKMVHDYILKEYGIETGDKIEK
jgi:hypothetical protein